jgi:hypothetical protein
VRFRKAAERRRYAMPSTRSEKRNDQLRAAHEKLQRAVEEIVSGDDWKRMLGIRRGSIATASTTIW